MVKPYLQCRNLPLPLVHVVLCRIFALRRFWDIPTYKLERTQAKHQRRLVTTTSQLACWIIGGKAIFPIHNPTFFLSCSWVVLLSFRANTFWKTPQHNSGSTPRQINAEGWGISTGGRTCSFTWGKTIFSIHRLMFSSLVCVVLQYFCGWAVCEDAPYTSWSASMPSQRKYPKRTNGEITCRLLRGETAFSIHKLTFSSHFFNFCDSVHGEMVVSQNHQWQTMRQLRRKHPAFIVIYKVRLCDGLFWEKRKSPFKNLPFALICWIHHNSTKVWYFV